MNVSLIACAVLLSQRLDVPIMALAWGVLIAGIVQLLFQIPSLLRLGLLPRPRWGWKHSGVRKVIRLMIPTLIGSSAAQVNLLIDSILATFLAFGSLSWLYYSDRLLEFPLGVFGIALATVILPNLSRKYAQQSSQAFSDTLDWALRLSLLITLPAAAGLVVLASPILATLFQYGKFMPLDVHMASLSLVAYAVGLPAFIAVKVLAPGYFARQDTKTPVKISLIAMGSNVVLNLLFIGSLLHVGFEGPHAGLALASSVSAFLNAGLLYRGLRRNGTYRPCAGWRKLIFSVFFACLTMAITLYMLVPDNVHWTAMSAMVRAFHLAGYIALGGLAYALAALLSGLRPAHFSRAGL